MKNFVWIIVGAVALFFFGGKLLGSSSSTSSTSTDDAGEINGSPANAWYPIPPRGYAGGPSLPRYESSAPLPNPWRPGKSDGNPIRRLDVGGGNPLPVHSGGNGIGGMKPVRRNGQPKWYQGR